MPKINMTIDLDIEEGLYIKIDAAGRVSIKADEKQTLIARQALQELRVPEQVASGSWASAKHSLRTERNSVENYYSRYPHVQKAIESILRLTEPFTCQTLLDMGVKNPWQLTSRLIAQGLIRIQPNNYRMNACGRSTPTVFEVVHNA